MAREPVVLDVALTEGEARRVAQALEHDASPAGRRVYIAVASQLSALDVSREGVRP